MKSYYRLMLGKKSMYARECFDGGFVGIDFGIQQDLSNELPDDWRAFNKKFIPKFLEGRPHKTRVAAGLVVSRKWEKIS